MNMWKQTTRFSQLDRPSAGTIVRFESGRVHLKPHLTDGSLAKVITNTKYCVHVEFTNSSDIDIIHPEYLTTPLEPTAEFKRWLEEMEGRR
jgi:hypothetical protein